MMRRLLVCLLPLLLVRATPPVPRLAPAVIRLAPPAPLVVQACTYQNAATRFREVIYDGRGYPYGEVSAWSCLSADAALSEFNTRKAAMQAEAIARYP